MSQDEILDHLKGLGVSDETLRDMRETMARIQEFSGNVGRVSEMAESDGSIGFATTMTKAASIGLNNPILSEEVKRVWEK